MSNIAQIATLDQLGRGRYLTPATRTLALDLTRTDQLPAWVGEEGAHAAIVLGLLGARSRG